MSSQQFARRSNNKKRRYRPKGRGLNKKQKMQIERMISTPVEKKYYDYPFNATQISLTPTIYNLTAMGPGTDKSSLIGEDWNIVNMSYRFQFSKADTTNYIRFIIFQWLTDSSTDAPNWNQIFEFHTASLPVDQKDIMSPYILDGATSGLFKILVDQQFYLDEDNSKQSLTGFINKGFRKTARTNTSLAASPGTNHIYLMMVSDSGTAFHPTVSGYTRLRYTDA